jgi:prepilin-type processing-associated H-X9-DG protein
MQTGRSQPDLLKRGGLTLPELLFTIAAVFVLLVLLLPVLAHSRARAKKINCTNHLKQIGLACRMWALDHGDKFPMQVSVTNGGVMELVEAGRVYPAFLVLSNDMLTPKILICPAESNSNRVAATTFDSSRSAFTFRRSIPLTNENNVSYFVGLDADEGQPNSILVGDDNFAAGGVPVPRGLLPLWTNSPIEWTSLRHSNHGNIGLADGSVQGTSTPRLRSMLCETRLTTNRLAIP